MEVWLLHAKHAQVNFHLSSRSDAREVEATWTSVPAATEYVSEVHRELVEGLAALSLLILLEDLARFKASL